MASNLLIRSIKPSLLEGVDQAKASVPGLVDSGVAKIVPAITDSVGAVTAQFQRVYADTASRIAVWIPTKAPGVVAGANTVLLAVRKKIEAL